MFTMMGSDKSRRVAGALPVFPGILTILLAFVIYPACDVKDMYMTISPDKRIRKSYGLTTWAEAGVI